MPSENRQERELIAAYLDGEPEAVGTLEQWIAKAAASYRRRLGSRWEDALQEIHLEVYRLLSRDQFEGRARLRTYLWRVVSHSCLDQIRAQGRRQETELEDPGLKRLALEQSADRRRWSESADLVRRVMERISEECQLLWAMVLAGKSYREMSAELGVAEGTLRVRVMRCRKRAVELRRQLLASAEV